MKYIGIAILMICVIVFARDYTAHVKKRQRECDEFLSLIGYMKIQIGCFMRPPKELISGFDFCELNKAGFAEAIEESDTLGVAFGKIEDKLSLLEEEKRLISNLFRTIGEVYINEGIALLNNSFSALENIQKRLNEEIPKSVRLVSTLSVTLTIAFIILLI